MKIKLASPFRQMAPYASESFAPGFEAVRKYVSHWVNTSTRIFMFGLMAVFCSFTSSVVARVSTSSTTFVFIVP